MLVHLAGYWGALSLLPPCDAFLAMLLRSHGTELMDRTLVQHMGISYRSERWAYVSCSAGFSVLCGRRRGTWERGA